MILHPFQKGLFTLLTAVEAGNLVIFEQLLGFLEKRLNNPFRIGIKACDFGKE